MNLDLPFAKDKANNDKPSVTLLFAYVSFLLTLGLNIFEAFRDPIASLFGSTILFTICIVLYRMRRVDSLRISRDSVEVDSSDSRKI